jgi:hypothetical protein
MGEALTVVRQLRWIAIAATVDNGLVDDNPTVIVDFITANAVAALFIVLCNFDFLCRIAST